MSAINPGNHPDALRLTDSQFIREETSSLFSAMDSALRWISLYLLELLASTLGVVVLTGFFLNVILKPIEPLIGRATLFSVARGPYYVFPADPRSAGRLGKQHPVEGKSSLLGLGLPVLYLRINLNELLNFSPADFLRRKRSRSPAQHGLPNLNDWKDHREEVGNITATTLLTFLNVSHRSE